MARAGILTARARSTASLRLRIAGSGCCNARYARFADYTPEANRRLVASSYRKVQSAVKVRPEELDATLAQPARTTCTLSAPKR